jgi:hypothetical protein
VKAAAARGLHLDEIMRKNIILLSVFFGFIAVSPARSDNTGTGFTNGTNDNAKGTEVITGQESPQSGATSGVINEVHKIEAKKAKKNHHRKQPVPAPNGSDAQGSAPAPEK